MLVRPSFRRRAARVIDAAPTGRALGLWLDEPLEAGDVLALEVRGLKQETAIYSGTVVNCVRMGDGTWLAGCELARPLSGAELAFLRGRPGP